MGKKSNVVSTESIPSPVFFSLSVIVICIFLLSSIVYILILCFFQDKVKCSFFLCKVVTSVYQIVMFMKCCEVINKIIFLLKKHV